MTISTLTPELATESGSVFVVLAFGNGLFQRISPPTTREDAARIAAAQISKVVMPNLVKRVKAACKKVRPSLSDMAKELSESCETFAESGETATDCEELCKSYTVLSLALRDWNATLKKGCNAVSYQSIVVEDWQKHQTR